MTPKLKSPVLIAVDDDGNAPVCRKCNKGHLSLELGGETGYLMQCDSPECGHSYAVVPQTGR